ncbi:PREDICTED: N-acetyltransferase ESCO2 [Wasmannia auropunctata]|uniref:N-acetyltransferase ESCO2 n=1 Tax=Wasmannia auropunctata TaxID=64793 RepID=UPI0005ED5ED0|nr:PREDICTED: N-acetyltransferase ESCO2 [Wasmannia auropunctata]XP_011699285.1 PREDICTED: N-acetyltransferase ESCO2 [Wasmannia auropunctata]
METVDSSQGKLLCTPRRAQKCLFASSDDKSVKRGVAQDPERVRDNDKTSGDESDLGPMSPLALTDRSPSISDSDVSSSGREFVSPFATPEKTPTTRSHATSWDRLRFSAEERMLPFRSLRKVTRAARYSPRCKHTGGYSPRSLSSTPEKLLMVGPLTPQRVSKTTDADQMTNEIVPETPQRSFATEIQNQSITETPRKGRSPERPKQTTPLSSVSKTVPLPRVHRRKSLSAIETSGGLSPEQKENTLKRRARDQSSATRPTKLFKSDYGGLAPRARASLFQERRHETCGLKNNFSLSTKTFYSGNVKSERPFGSSFRSNDVKRRRSLPPQSSSRRLSVKKRKFGRINAGVYHGIKKPKPKEALKKEGQHDKQSPTTLSKNPPVEDAQPMETTAIAERPPSPMIDESKRFFKTNKTIRQNQAATVTMSDKIKLKVADGKIELKENQKRPPSMNARKRKPSVVDVPLDATDLTVDEPEVEVTLQQEAVADLLKILEDDWANDDYDTMAPLSHIANAFSSKPPTTLLPPQDTIMSPATELSNMTSTMNINKDAPLTNFENLSLENTNNNNNDIEKETGEENTEKRYFPLFTKGYSEPDNIFKETLSNVKDATKAVKKNMQWQLSKKAGGAEDQYQLDVGQKRLGATQCLECNVVYQLGDAEDENAHLNYHNSIRTLKFQGWKNERVILEDSFTSSRIILVEPHDPKQYWKKVLEILAVVDRDLGLSDIDTSEYQSKKIFLYIREKSVLGVLVAEHIEKAFRMIPELIELNCCTAESTPTKCGINVVWTAMSHRKQGIATKLVDTLRAKFFYGYVMSLDDIAFSIPTPSGKIFAEKYTKMKNFKVYN